MKHPFCVVAIRLNLAHSIVPFAADTSIIFETCHSFSGDLANARSPHRDLTCKAAGWPLLSRDSRLEAGLAP